MEDWKKEEKKKEKKRKKEKEKKREKERERERKTEKKKKKRLAQWIGLNRRVNIRRGDTGCWKYQVESEFKLIGAHVVHSFDICLTLHCST